MSDDDDDVSLPFHGESLDLNEYPSVLRGIKKCRSFRADLTHKLEIILRAYGGRTNEGLWRTCLRLGTSRHSLRRWLKWERMPQGRLMYSRIDNVYEDSLEILAKQACGKSTRMPTKPQTY